MSNDPAALDVAWMKHALILAVRGRGLVEPNPLVGCVIVRDGRLIGQGYHERFGGPHAEINALTACHETAEGATAYVTLEPCCHTGKKTPPCVPTLIAAGLARVVVGCIDPNPAVSGEGVRQLRAAGIEVREGVLEPQCRQLIAPYVAQSRLGRPYVTLKWAISSDGKVAGSNGRPVTITNRAAMAAVHALRGRCDAIAIGTNTLVNDNPSLTARTPDPPRRPLRVVFSNSLSLPPDARLFATPEAGRVIVYTHAHANTQAVREIQSLGAEIVQLPSHDNGRGGMRFSMSDAYYDLASRGVTHLMIEPGPKLARELISRNQADAAWIFTGQNPIGGDGLPAPECSWPETGASELDGDRLVERLNPASEAFHALEPSPDFLIASGNCPRQH